MLMISLAFAGDPTVAAHLEHTLAELRLAPTEHLDTHTRIRRASLLDALDSYIAAGQFPHNHVDPVGRPAPVAVVGGMDFEPGRTPVFVDDAGSHCAVGYLLAVDGREDLVEQAQATDNTGYLTELMHPGLEAWADEAGFTIAELARIQPGYGFIHSSYSRLASRAAEVTAAGTCEPLWSPAPERPLHHDYMMIRSGQDGVNPHLPQALQTCAVQHPTKPGMGELVQLLLESGPPTTSLCSALSIHHDNAKAKRRKELEQRMKECKVFAKSLGT